MSIVIFHLIFCDEVFSLFKGQLFYFIHLVIYYVGTSQSVETVVSFSVANLMISVDLACGDYSGYVISRKNLFHIFFPQL